MDDLISRAAALNAIDCWHIDFNSIDGAKVQTECWKTIEQLPSVDAVPIAQCEWVEEPDRVNHYHCSNCGVVWGVMSKAMKYCPNCAAKMMNSPMWEVEGNNGKDA